ncbi:MAG: Fur family ferric uptake transcriptional regulator [Candidatus Paceibacteria bacterium]
MEHELIRSRFEGYLRSQSLKLTSQREAIFERAFSTHEHFTAETLHRWMGDDAGGDSHVSRATVYRTLSLLVEGGFIGSFDSGRGELLYEHLLGHKHHDHLVCLVCGRIEEFCNDSIEELQKAVAAQHGFLLQRHSLRLEGICRACTCKAGERSHDVAPSEVQAPDAMPGAAKNF